ncbi:MAG TPA: hypothetical protein VMU77_05725, partial [Acidimicrobiales bacterium]|nr:hypothetical protein [Acidimicrobiales bacterium]
MSGAESERAWEKSVQGLDISRMALAVLSIFVLISIGLGIGIRGVVSSQEHRILGERSKELVLLLDQSVASIGAELPAIAAVESVSPPQSKLFNALTIPLLQSGKNSVVVLEKESDHFLILTEAGNSSGFQVNPPVDNIASRALSRSGLTGSILTYAHGRELAIAEGVNGIVVLDISPVRTSKTPSQPPGSPFSDVNLSMYASPSLVPADLLLTSG